MNQHIAEPFFINRQRMNSTFADAIVQGALSRDEIEDEIQATAKALRLIADLQFGRNERE
ncbi:hypothetical protein [Asaia sp. VD9]|uniref:hypothetical protein n=1 Tax=Asaia sp. VD9 TaxID=3081235 RepID=UPI003017B294